MKKMRIEREKDKDEDTLSNITVMREISLFYPWLI